MLGYKFSIIASSYYWIPSLEEQLQRFGLKDKLTSIRYPKRLEKEKPFDWFNEEKQEEDINILTEEMSTAVKEDGAEVLIVGFSVTSTLLTMKGINEVDGAPIIDIMVGGVKMAEIMVDLQRVYETKVCRATIYFDPPNWEKERPIHIN